MSGVITANNPTITTNFGATSLQVAGSSKWSVKSTHAEAWRFGMGSIYRYSRHIGFDFAYASAKLKYSSYTYSEALQNGTSLSISGSSPIYMYFGVYTLSADISYYF